MPKRLNVSAEVVGTDIRDSFDIDVTGLDEASNGATVDFDLDDNINGGKLIEFNYDKTLNELTGKWSAKVAGGNFQAGDAFSTNAMKNGMVFAAHKTPDGLWELSGNDAGYRLMKTTPSASEIAKGAASAVIYDLAAFCGIKCRMNGSGLSGFNVRSAISGGTCAEAILELVLMSGMIAYINEGGELIVDAPKDEIPVFKNVIDDSGSEIDLDGYASRVYVTITRRKETPKEQGETTGEGNLSYFTGKTPPGSTRRNTIGGTINYVDATGKKVTGSYSQTIIEPLGVTERLFHSVTRDGITITTTEEHDYTINTRTVWRSDSEYRLWAWAETGYKIMTVSEGGYQGAKGFESFREIKTEFMTRNFSIFNAPFLPPDWRYLNMIDREDLTITTQREGGIPVQEGMPPYSPEYDKKLSRKYQRTDFGQGVLVAESELKYEKRNVGHVSPLYSGGERVLYASGAMMALPSYSGAHWVRIETLRTIYEKYNDHGEPLISVSSEFDDNGAKWLFQNKFSQADSEQPQNEYQEQYAKFTDKANATKITMNGGSISSSAWQFLEQEGRTISYFPPATSGGVPIQAENWYLNGEYAPSKYCPHYGMDNSKCSVWQISALNNFEGEQCKYNGLGWRPCIRAVAALEQARRDNDAPLLESPVIRTASAGTSQEVWASRELYVDDIISTATAESIAQRIANNILKVKGTKGLRKTIVLPYSPNITTDGSVIAVSHDWKGLKTTVKYKAEGVFPDCMIPSSMAGIASMISDRQSKRQSKAVTGVVKQIFSDGSVKVAIGGGVYVCSSKKTNIGVNDSVLVSFPAGNSLRGIIVERI